MSYRYRLRLRPAARLYFSSPAQTTQVAETLIKAIDGLVVHDHGETDVGDHVFVVGLERPTHEQVLDELFVATQQFGYAWAEAEISEVSNEAVGGAILGALGGGGAVSKSESPFLMVCTAIIGGIAGNAIGSRIEQSKVILHVHRSFPQGWVLVAVSPHENDAVVGRWRFA